MKPLDTLMALAGHITRAVQDAQQVAEVGLGDTYADTMAVGSILQGMGVDPDIPTYMLGHACVRWWRGGVARFRLSHSLATQFALTDVDGIDASELRLPFPTFIVELPHPNGPLLFDSAEEDPRDSREEEVIFLVVNRYMGSSKLLESFDLSSFSHGGWRDRVRDCMKTKVSAPWDLPMIRLELLGPRMTTVDDTWALQGALDCAAVVPKDEFARATTTSRDLRAVEIGRRIVVNLALYLKHVASTSQSGGRTVNHDHGISSLLYELGNDVKIDARLRQAARDYCVSGRRPEPWKLAKRFIVRGHWKRQPVGPERAERKMIFVEPYWKGPADAPAIARAYVDDGPKGQPSDG